MAKRKQTLFGKSKYKYLSKIVDFENPKKARVSAEKLLGHFANAKTMSKRLRVAKATQKAANMAKSSSKRKNLSSKERKEYKEISTIYDKTADLMYEQYNEMKKYL